MTTLFTRSFNLKESLSAAEVFDYWRFFLSEVVPALESIEGSRSVKLYTGAGGLRADLCVQWELDDAGVQERAMDDPRVRKLLGRIFRAWDMKSAGQSFRRQITPELIGAVTKTD